MMEWVQVAITEVVPAVTFASLITIAHNYTAIENHFGKNVFVHSKGATSARFGEYKDINQVMATQTDLVDFEVSFAPLAVVKG